MFKNRCFDSKSPPHLLIASRWSLAPAILALLFIFIVIILGVARKLLITR